MSRSVPIVTEPLVAPAPTAADSWRCFDRIAGRYDLLNRLLSFRRDVAWRTFLLTRLPSGNDLTAIDIATGTGDVLLALARDDRVKRGLGLDMAAGMLVHAHAKVDDGNGEHRFGLTRGDACTLPLRDGSFDVATMAFGIRNVPDVPKALREARRILKPGGKVLILEFSLPANPLFRRLYLVYFRHVLPRVGGWISGDRAAYTYLNRSVEQFPYGEAFLRMLRDANFRDVRANPLTLGIATLYEGTT